MSLFIDGMDVVSHCHVPQWMRTLGITELKLAGAISGLTSAAEFSPGRNALLRCDNQGARGVITRGHSRTGCYRGLASVFWSASACASIHVWVEFVRSSANYAGDPSRLCSGSGERRCKTPTGNVGIPNSLYNMAHSKEAYEPPPLGAARMTKWSRLGPVQNGRPTTFHGWYARGAI